jgi:hypothetical protein
MFPEVVNGSPADLLFTASHREGFAESAFMRRWPLRSRAAEASYRA